MRRNPRECSLLRWAVHVEYARKKCKYPFLRNRPGPRGTISASRSLCFPFEYVGIRFFHRINPFTTIGVGYTQIIAIQYLAIQPLAINKAG